MIQTTQASSQVKARNPRAAAERAGSILLIVLVSVVLLSLAAYTFSELAYSDYETSTVVGQSVQARRLAESGIDYARYLAYVNGRSAADRQIIEDAGGLFNNPNLFMGGVVIDDPVMQFRGKFTVVSPDYLSNPGMIGIRYGLEDESARINLNTLLLVDSLVASASLGEAARELLMSIPNMNEYAADAILDWIDVDDDQREFGAESDYYMSLPAPYVAANRPPATLEELLLVKDVTPGLLFGSDGNRNFLAEAGEESIGGALGVVSDPQSGVYSGWAPYLSVHSAERNVNPDGGAKVDLNNTDLVALEEALNAILDSAESENFDPVWIPYIIALRAYGPVDAEDVDEDEDQENQEDGNVQIVQPNMEILGDLEEIGETAFTLEDVLDLIGKEVRFEIESENEDEDPITIVFPAQFPNDPSAMFDYLPVVLDWLAVNTDTVIPGRININRARYEILAAIPGAPAGFADSVSARQLEATTDYETYRHEMWPLTEGIVTVEEMKSILPFVCAGGSVYRGQFIGFFDGGGPSARIEAVIDASGPTPRVLLWRNISHLGRGYDLGTLGSDAAAEESGFNY